MAFDQAQDVDAVRAVGAAYCEALWVSDVDVLRAMFHPRANLYGVSPDGALEEYTLEAWLDIVGARAPAAGEPQYTLHHVSCPADDLGIITLDAAVTDRAFTDTLSVLKLDGTWRVIAKTFHLHR